MFHETATHLVCMFRRRELLCVRCDAVYVHPSHCRGRPESCKAGVCVKGVTFHLYNHIKNSEVLDCLRWKVTIHAIDSALSLQDLNPKGTPWRPGQLVYSVFTEIRCLHYKHL